MCTKEIHQKLIQEEDAVMCIFCCKQIQDPGRPKRCFCCSNMNIIKERYLVCKNCGQLWSIVVKFTLPNTLTFMKIDMR